MNKGEKAGEAGQLGNCKCEYRDMVICSVLLFGTEKHSLKSLASAM